MFQSSIEDTIISNLQYENFINLFENELYNKESKLLIDINSFIKELNLNTSKKVNPTLQSLKIVIKNYVESKIILKIL